MLASAIGGLLLGATIAGAASLGFETGSIVAPAGTQIAVPLQADFVAGEGVLSLEADLLLPANWTVVGIDGTDGLLDDWSNDHAVQFVGNHLSFSAVGLDPLTGTGTLFSVLAQVDGSGWTTVETAIANEGFPAVTTANGYFTHSLPPVLNVQPATPVELLVGETRAHGAVGAVDPPVTWSVADPISGTVDESGLFTAIATGSSRVLGVDAAGRMGQGGEISILPFEMRAGEADGTAGFDLLLPIALANPGGAGFSSLEFLLDLESPRLSCSLFETDDALCDGWDIWLLQQPDGRVRVAAAAPDGVPITGEGELLRLVVSTQAGGALHVTPDVDEARLDETTAVRRVSGSLTLAGTGSFQLAPNTALIKRGRTLQMQVSGTPNGALSWTSLDATVATVDDAGLLSAVAGGMTRVVAVDPLGVSDTTAAIRVYDVDVAPEPRSLPVGQLGRVPIRCDSLAGLTVGSWEVAIDYDTLNLHFVGVEVDSTLSENWNEVEWVDDGGGALRAAGAGATLPQEGNVLLRLLFLTDADAPIGGQTQLQLSEVRLNEGSPVARGGNATIHYRDPEVAVGDPVRPPRFELGAAYPNPFNPTTVLPFTLDSPGEVRLAIHNLLGEEVRVLVAGHLSAGSHLGTWDGRDDQSRPLAGGVYFARLEAGGEARTKRLTLIK